jgi:DNA-binding NarL/FixJ family response regulator
MESTADYVSVSSPRSSTFAIGAIVGDPSLRRRLGAALDMAGFDLCAHGAEVEDLAAAACTLDAVVLYQRIGRGAALGAVRAAKDALPDTALIAVWTPHHRAAARKAINAGADGLISEDELETTLVPTLRAVLSGLVCVPSIMRAPLETESLSMREKQVLSMVVTGFTNAEIATKLYLAESTVKSHLSSAYNKLGVASRKDAASLIMDPLEGLGPGILAISAA